MQYSSLLVVAHVDVFLWNLCSDFLTYCKKLHETYLKESELNPCIVVWDVNLGL